MPNLKEVLRNPAFKTTLLTKLRKGKGLPDQGHMVCVVGVRLSPSSGRLSGAQARAVLEKGQKRWWPEALYRWQALGTGGREGVPDGSPCPK